MYNQPKKRISLPLIFLLLSLPLLFFIVAAVLPADDVPASFASLSDLLIWIGTGGGAMVLAGYVNTFLLENWAKWHAFPRWVKITFPLLMAGLFGVLAQSFIALDIVTQLPEVISIVLLAAINWVAGQLAYKNIKDSSYGVSARRNK